VFCYTFDMNIYKVTLVILMFLLCVAIAPSAFAQTESEKRKTYVSSGSLGTATPIPLEQILSGKGNLHTSGLGVAPYVPSGGVGYDMAMSTSSAMQYRARRDAMAQAQTKLAFDDMNQSYLDKEYQQAFQKYQAQFRTDGKGSSSSTSKVGSIKSSNVNVKYKKNRNKIFVTPKRVFKAY